MGGQIGIHTWGAPKIPRIAKNKLFKVFVQVWNFSPFRRSPPCDWMQRSQRRSQCWKHCLKSSTEMLSRATSNSRWTSAMSANCLPFKSCFIHGNKESFKECGRVKGRGPPPLFIFSQKEGILLTLQRFNKNHQWPSTAFLLKMLDSVSNNVSGTWITASGQSGSSLKATKVSNLYNCSE